MDPKNNFVMNLVALPVSVSIDYIRLMDMKLISATVCMLVSRPYIIIIMSIEHSQQIHSFKTSYT